MSIADKKYKELIQDIYTNGSWDKGQKVRTKYADGSPAYSKSIFGRQVVFEADELPLVTCKKMFPITAIKEIYLFWIKQSNKKEDFDALNCKIWDEWMIPDGIYQDTLGTAYCKQFTASDGRNQVVELLHNIKNNPTSRRLMTSFWNYEEVKDKALQECAWATQWHVSGDSLDLMLIQRSADIGLGVPFNWFEYKALQHLVAHCTGYKAGRFIHQLGCVHYYDRHEEQLLNLLNEPEYEQPTLILNTDKGTDFFSYSWSDFKIANYKHGSNVAMEVAI